MEYVVSDNLKVTTEQQMWCFSFCLPPAVGKLLKKHLLLIHAAWNPFILAGLGAIIIYSLSCKLFLVCEILICLIDMPCMHTEHMNSKIPGDFAF